MYTDQSKFNQQKKRIIWDDVTKHSLFHKAANLVDSFKHRNVKCVINISNAYIVSALL